MLLSKLSPNIIPFDWQAEASAAIVDTLTTKNGALLRAGTGTGKMYMAAQSIRTLLELDLLVKPPGSINPFTVLWLTPKSVKSQTQRVVFEYGLTSHVMVMSYSEIKSAMGAMYITWIDDGICQKPIWNLNMLPALVKCDECQVLKNPKSLQSIVVRALPETVKSIFASATPFQRTIDATTLCERFRVVTPYNTLPCVEATSERLVSNIASPKNKDEYSPSAVERLRSAIADYIVELKNVRFKYPSHTKCVSIAFKDNAEASAYQKLVDRLIENLNKRKGRDEDSYVFFLVEMQKMQQGAELLRKNHICDRVVANQSEKAVIVASNFVDTINAVHYELTHNRGISQDRIAIIVGGQKPEERQTMVDEFQKGKRDIMLFTMRSGGVGVSMHHDRASTKPRHIILPPTWSAIDLVQALGRAHRLTSMSATTQEILWYGGTIEDAVKIKVELKIKCLSKAVTAKEQFVDTFIAQVDKTIEAEKLVDESEKLAHVGDNVDNDDTDSKDEEDAITGEGLDSVEQQ